MSTQQSCDEKTTAPVAPTPLSLYVNRGKHQHDRMVRVCVSCSQKLPAVDILLGTTPLLKPLANIVIQYMGQNQTLGYFVLHKPSRRRIHVICKDCQEMYLDTQLNLPMDGCLDNNPPMLICPAADCMHMFSPIDLIEVRAS